MHNKQQITGWLFLLLLCVAGCGQPVSKKQNTMIYNTKLLQKSEMRKEIVIELSYKGFSRASDYS